MTATGEGEVVALRRLAEEMAKGRGERATTGHLLAAIASNSGGAAQLLRERRLDAEVLLKAARVLVDDHSDAVSRAVQRARELAARSPTREASAIHLLFALCQERSTAAYRAIAQCGSDVTKLRTAAMQIALGIVAPRRPSTATQLALPPTPPAHAPHPGRTAASTASPHLGRTAPTVAPRPAPKVATAPALAPRARR